jgi:ribosomal protein S18 acetylase RimI-like enzyme
MLMTEEPGDDAAVELRMFSNDDYDELMGLWERAGLPGRPGGRDSREAMGKQLKDDHVMILLAVAGGGLVGSVIITQDGRKGWVNRLAVAPEYRRTGVARKLVEEGERRLRDLGFGIVGVIVEGWNTHSMEVFERLGYTRYDDFRYFARRFDPDF